ncbi:MAG TPA: Smr/MutS family protein [Puia sp.]
MKFEIGDKVLVLHSSEEGEIVDIINKEMVMVDVHGVKFPAYIDQLDFPYFKKFTEKKPLQEKPKKYVDDVRKEKSNQNKIADGVWLTFLPVFDSDEFGDEFVKELKLHLINNTLQGYNFSYSLNYFGKDDFELKNQIHTFEDFYLHDIAFEDINDNPNFQFDFSLLTPEKKKAEHYETLLKIKPKNIFLRVEEMKKTNQATFSYKLFDDYPDKTVEEKIELKTSSNNYKIYEASQTRNQLEPAKHEVDLHIEKLTDNWRHMSNFEMLTLQLQTFEKYFDLAVAHHLPSMIMIHGVGSGKLRDEIHDLLRMKRNVKSFINQYHARYGYGATEIFFQY